MEKSLREYLHLLFKSWVEHFKDDVDISGKEWKKIDKYSYRYDRDNELALALFKSFEEKNSKWIDRFISHWLLGNEEEQLKAEIVNEWIDENWDNIKKQNLDKISY